MPISDASPSAGTAVVLPFPCADRLAEKRRPAVVVSNPAVVRAGFVWIALITRARNAAMPGDLPITDLDAAGLAKPSVVRPLKIAGIDETRIRRRAGALAPEAADHLFARVRSMIGHS